MGISLFFCALLGRMEGKQAFEVFHAFTLAKYGVSGDGELPEPSSPSGFGRRNTLDKDLTSALSLLSEQLYTEQTHFIMELIQNAADCIFGPNESFPWLRFEMLSSDIKFLNASTFLSTLPRVETRRNSSRGGPLFDF